MEENRELVCEYDFSGKALLSEWHSAAMSQWLKCDALLDDIVWC